MATSARRPLVAGNWKMNGLKESLVELVKIMHNAGNVGEVDLLVCPPATLLTTFTTVAAGSKIAIGGQDCHGEPSGPFTGDISAEMLADAGASAVIVGHSERRAKYKETDADVRAKATAAFRAGLTAIVCIGETAAERDDERTLEVLARQFDGSLPEGVTADNLVIAYEPVWAIGTGVTPSPADVAQAHEFVRHKILNRYGSAGLEFRILYGGSVKPSNAKELMAVENVNGALVGGASLKAEDFLGIAAVYRTPEVE